MSSHTVQAAFKNHEVYLGIWTNWSHGSITGLTLTTTLQNGGLLIAFLALFVTFTGTCFWSIVAFAAHQAQSRQGSQSAVYHQRQAILRNSGTSATACWKLSRLLWAWGRRSPASVTKGTLFSLTMGSITFGAFAAAGIFSSRVASTRGGEVLLIGEKCASLDQSQLDTVEKFARVQAAKVRTTRSSANYALSCYNSDSSAENCRTFVRHNMPFDVTTNIPCPFPGKDKICRSPNGGIRLDSGHINSHFDLGINSPPSERFFYRMVNECAPVQNEGFTHVDESQSTATLKFLYGADPRSCADRAGECTFQQPTNLVRGSDFELDDYTIHIVTHNVQIDADNANVTSSWTPIPELVAPDADISVIFLAGNNVLFNAPLNDPWFSAGHNDDPIQLGSALGTTSGYLSDDPARALACAQRYQFCNSSMPQDQGASCTPLLGMEAAVDAAQNLFPQSKENEKFSWSAYEIQQLARGLPNVIGALKSGSLLARDSLAYELQDTLPDNHWELELQHWFKFTLAELQRTILDQATGPADAYARQFYTPPTLAGEREVCNNQKILSDSYTSFNVLGLVLIFSIGGFIIFLSTFLPHLTRRLQRRRKPFAGLEWVTNDTLQLQRLAHERLGAGAWEGACDDFPRTRDGNQLAVLDITDQKHPFLRVSDEAMVLKQRESPDLDR